MKTFLKTSVFLGVLFLVARTSIAGPQEVYNKAIRSVVWIVNRGGNSTGSGVLIDRQRGLIVTCYHVSEPADEVEVFFAYRDAGGALMMDGKYYLRNKERLAAEGYAVTGRVVARDKEKDLAVLRVTKLPEDARAISLAKEDPRPDDRLQVIGNPGINPNLWRTALGAVSEIGKLERTYPDGHKVSMTALYFYCDVTGGYSGGPVLDSNGRLVGICHANNFSEGGLGSLAVLYREVKEILATVETQHVFSIRNRTVRDVRCMVRFGDSDWQTVNLRPGERRVFTAAAGEPEVRFNAATEGRQTRKYSIEANDLSFGKGYSPNPRTDARAYCFEVDGRDVDLFAEG